MTNLAAALDVVGARWALLTVVAAGVGVLVLGRVLRTSVSAP